MLNQTVDKLIIVSGIVLSGFMPYDLFTEEYIRVLGCLNSSIGREADVVLETVCAIPIIHKGKDILQGERV